MMHSCCIREGDLHRLAKKTDEAAATELSRVFAEDVLYLETTFWEVVDKDSETPLGEKPTGSSRQPLLFVIDKCSLVTIPTMSNLLFLGLCNRSRAGPQHQI
jgi:hypothetical protein